MVYTYSVNSSIYGPFIDLSRIIQMYENWIDDNQYSIIELHGQAMIVVRSYYFLFWLSQYACGACGQVIPRKGTSQKNWESVL